MLVTQFGARVIAVADSFDAMTSDRPYRTGMPTGKAAQILREGRGLQWEPMIVDAFLRHLEKEHPQATFNPTATEGALILATSALAEPAIA